MRSHPLPRSVARTAAALAISALAACQSVPVTSLPALSRIDPFALDPTSLRAAIVHPSAIAFVPGETLMTMRVTRVGEGVVMEEAFALAQADGQSVVPVPDGARSTLFSVASGEDTMRFNAFLSEMRALRDAQAGKHSFAISIRPSVCGGTRAADATVSAYVAGDGSNRFVPIVRNQAIEKIGASVTRCAAPPAVSSAG